MIRLSVSVLVDLADREWIEDEFVRLADEIGAPVRIIAFSLENDDAFKKEAIAYRKALSQLRKESEENS